MILFINKMGECQTDLTKLIPGIHNSDNSMPELFFNLIKSINEFDKIHQDLIGSRLFLKT